MLALLSPPCVYAGQRRNHRLASDLFAQRPEIASDEIQAALAVEQDPPVEIRLLLWGPDVEAVSSGMTLALTWNGHVRSVRARVPKLHVNYAR